MATVTASGTLTSSTNLFAQTGFIAYNQGLIDPANGSITAEGTNSWLALSGTTWNTFNSYVDTYQVIKWTAPELDLGSAKYFTLNITSEFSGTINYLIHTSVSGDLATDVTEYYISDGDLNISAFYGRYCYVTAIVTGTSLLDMQISADTSSQTYHLPNIDSSTLSGTITARQIPMPATVSAITDIQIQPKSATAYAVNLYVSDTATSTVTIPVIVSKNPTSPTFALSGIDNDPRDAVVDITISTTPRMAMIGGNIQVVS